MCRDAFTPPRATFKWTDCNGRREMFVEPVRQSAFAGRSLLTCGTVRSSSTPLLERGLCPGPGPWPGKTHRGGYGRGTRPPPEAPYQSRGVPRSPGAARATCGGCVPWSCGVCALLPRRGARGGGGVLSGLVQPGGEKTAVVRGVERCGRGRGVSDDVAHARWRGDGVTGRCVVNRDPAEPFLTSQGL
ncbi:hypothetical protein GCM10010420_14360 [Streptomyces glaucosporus]|uniref:Uncharacterized protein n=1 Tax=Streptomyces glaucosporus TaxID=284044 RepID=A0ABN3HZE3_9ACTN